MAMILGLSIANFTILHVIISLIGIAAGLVVMFAMLGSNKASGWTAIFLLFTVLTSATGFLFPFKGATPAFIVGVTSIVILAIALYALYGQHLASSWRWIYVLTAVLAQWFNSFVLFVQSFQKIGFLAALAPTQSEPPFMAAQGIELLFYVPDRLLAVRKFHPELRIA
jgi:hypothetical protein